MAASCLLRWDLCRHSRPGSDLPRWYIIIQSLLLSKHYINISYSYQVFANPEDTTSGGTVTYADSDVERVRRAHQNDLENIPIFLFASHFYLMTNPSAVVATNLIRVYTVARFLHTFVYLNQVGLPRSLEVMICTSSFIWNKLFCAGPTTIEGTLFHDWTVHHFLHVWSHRLPLLVKLWWIGNKYEKGIHFMWCPYTFWGARPCRLLGVMFRMNSCLPEPSYVHEWQYCEQAFCLALYK